MPRSIKLLVVEDHGVKEQQLVSALEGMLPGATILIARSYQSALGKLDEFTPDIAILDMTIPTFDRGVGETGGRARTYGGRDLLGELEARAPVVPAIVVSQYRQFAETGEDKQLSELEAELRLQFPRSFRGAVYFDAARASWQKRLEKRLKRVLKL